MTKNSRDQEKLNTKELIDFILQTDVWDSNIQLAEIRVSINLVTKNAVTNQGEIGTLKAKNFRLKTESNKLQHETVALRRTIDNMKENQHGNNEDNITDELKDIRSNKWH